MRNCGLKKRSTALREVLYTMSPTTDYWLSRLWHSRPPTLRLS